MMDDRTLNSLSEIKNQIEKKHSTKIIQLYLIGSSLGKEQVVQDIDLVAVIDDDVSVFTISKETSPYFKAISIEVGIMVSCFFINKITFQNSTSQYIKNVKKEGREL